MFPFKIHGTKFPLFRLASPPVDLYLISEKSIWKNCRWENQRECARLGQRYVNLKSV